MFLNALAIVAAGFLCLVLTIVSLVFGIISFANNKPHKFTWLGVFLCAIASFIICVFLFVRKAVDTVTNISENALSSFENYNDSLSTYIDSTNTQIHKADELSEQIKLLKNYLPSNMTNKDPKEFYTYLGFQDYYRYPLRYPYSIHYNYTYNQAELFNEVNVSRFDENDNGEIYAGIDYINKIAFDKNYLLIEQEKKSTRTDKLIKHYILFILDTEKSEEVKTEKELFMLAKQKGYAGSDTLMTLKQYYKLF